MEKYIQFEWSARISLSVHSMWIEGGIKIAPLPWFHVHIKLEKPSYNSYWDMNYKNSRQKIRRWVKRYFFMRRNFPDTRSSGLTFKLNNEAREFFFGFFHNLKWWYNPRKCTIFSFTFRVWVRIHSLDLLLLEFVWVLLEWWFQFWRKFVSVNENWWNKNTETKL